ncbi:MAG: Flp pilus assembly protein CpaB [Dehalococcoidia bacterium]|nr:Flp pilus assembly protein CpaB [Dehalococcoidia bacterium]
MARAGAGAPGGRINRRFLMLALVSAALSAVLVYVALNQGGTTDKASSETSAEIVVAAVEIPARTQITAEMVKLKSVPVSAKMTTVYEDLEDAVGRVTRYPIEIDEQVTSAKTVSLRGEQETDALAFVIPSGMRAISIKADQVLSAGGLVLPGDYVDILAVFNVEDQKGEEREAYLVRTILQNVEVLAVAQTIADVPPEEDTNGAANASANQGQRARASEAEPDPEATTLTLLVQPEQAEWLFLAEANGTLRAIVRGFGDSETPDVRPIIETELLPAGFVPPPPRAQ